MKPEDFDDPGTDAADRKDNRTAIVVAVGAAIVVGIASGILMATAGNEHSSAPAPTHSSVQMQSASVPGITG